MSNPIVPPDSLFNVPTFLVDDQKEIEKQEQISTGPGKFLLDPMTISPPCLQSWGFQPGYEPPGDLIDVSTYFRRGSRPTADPQQNRNACPPALPHFLQEAASKVEWCADPLTVAQPTQMLRTELPLYTPRLMNSTYVPRVTTEVQIGVNTRLEVKDQYALYLKKKKNGGYGQVGDWEGLGHC